MRGTKFIVKPEEKIVVAIMSGMEDVTNEVLRKCTKSTQHVVDELISSGRHFNCPKLDLPYKTEFRSVARCDDRDIFDEKIGKNISENKALLKYHTTMQRKYGRLSELLKKASKEIEELRINHILKAINIRKSLAKHVGIEFEKINV